MFFLFILSVCLCSVCMCALYAGAHWDHERHRITGSWSSRSLWNAWFGFWDLSSGPCDAAVSTPTLLHPSAWDGYHGVPQPGTATVALLSLGRLPWCSSAWNGYSGAPQPGMATMALLSLGRLPWRSSAWRADKDRQRSLKKNRAQFLEEQFRKLRLRQRHNLVAFV